MKVDYREMVCAYCPEWVSKDQPHRREVLSWVTPPPNSDSPVLRVYTTRLAHEECIQKQLHGIPVDQGDLFSELFPLNGNGNPGLPTASENS